VTKALVRRAIGLPVDEVLDLKAIKGVMEREGMVYGEVEAISPLAKTALTKFREARDLSRAYWKENDKMGTVVSEREAKKADAAAKSYLAVIEKELKRNGTPELYDKFQKARVTISKAHLIEDAFDTGSGTVMADIIAKRRKSGDTITTGELEIIANFAEAFPRSSDNKIERAAQSVVHPILASSAAYSAFYAGGAPAAASTAAIALMAPRGVREFLLSDAVQRSAIESSFKPRIPQDFSASVAQRAPMEMFRNPAPKQEKTY
jgi:hypothetical protein